jgi:hypothetical protein
METIFNLIGGRKMALVLIAVILVALRNVLGLDEDTIHQIIVVVLGGSGAIAFEDAAKSLASNATTTKKK